MIVAKGENTDGRTVLVLGLSAENLRRLQLHQPIDVPRAGLVASGLPNLQVCILFGETEAEIARELGVVFDGSRVFDVNHPTGRPQ